MHILLGVILSLDGKRCSFVKVDGPLTIMYDKVDLTRTQIIEHLFLHRKVDREVMIY